MILLPLDPVKFETGRECKPSCGPPDGFAYFGGGKMNCANE